MSTWGQLLARLQELRQQGRADAFDIIRREALLDLHNYTGRNVVLYASGHLQKPGVAPNLLAITNEDVEGFMEVFHGLSGNSLDLVLHSPGGRVEATEAIVKYIRSKFRHIRAIIPHEAMSAATMLACAADEIIMGRQSYLGPIDPQFQLQTSLGVQSVPAQAILDQFARAKRECTEDRANLAVWVPSLQQYGPALLEQCEHAKALSQELVTTWLTTWMFRRSRQRQERAETIAMALAKHETWRTHGRPLGLSYLRSLRMKALPLESDQKLQDKVLTVYHATMHTCRYSSYKNYRKPTWNGFHQVVTRGYRWDAPSSTTSSAYTAPATRKLHTLALQELLGGREFTANPLINSGSCI